MNKLKGFTLVEVLSAVLIISILLLIIISNLFVRKDVVKDEVDNINYDNLFNAVDIYYNEYSHIENWKEYKKDNITYSCISIKNLIDSGLYSIKDEFINKYLEHGAVKIKEENGVNSYELIENFNYDNDCNYWNVEDEFSNTNIEISMGETGTDEIKIIPTITKIDGGKYELSLKFTADKKVIEINNTYPIYVLIMLDKSGSMIHNDNGKDALKAINNMIDSIYNIDKSYIGFIDFGDNADNYSVFNNIWLDNNNKIGLKGYVSSVRYINGADNNYYEAFVKARDMYEIKNKGNKYTYVVMLSDAGNNNNGTSCISSFKRDNIANDIINNVEKFISIGYSPATTCLSDYASNNCGTNNNEKCYYIADSSDVVELFNNLTNSIIESINSQRVSSSKITLELGNDIKLYNNNGELVSNTLNVQFNIDDSDSDIYTDEVKYNFNVDEIDDDDYVCNYDQKECIYEVDIFKKFNIKLFDKNNDLYDEINVDTLPKLVITKKLVSYIN